MDIEQLLGGVLRGALGGRRKPHNKALRYLTGRRGGFLTPARAIGLAGLVWGVVETVMAQSHDAGQAPPQTAHWPGGAPSGAPPAMPRGVMDTTTPVVPPPLPGVAASSTTASGAVAGSVPVAPPKAVPSTSSAAAPAPTGPPAIGDPAASGPLGRIIRLTMSAARADGTLAEAERASIVAQARLVGLEALVDAELASPTPVEDIVAGLADTASARDLYTMAFTIVRADAGVDAAERGYLARLAAALGLDAETVAAIERETAREIEEQDA